MPRFRAAYPPEFRRQIVELGRSGRTPEELQREFEPTAQSIANWFRQADRDAGKRSDGATESQPTPPCRPCWTAKQRAKCRREVDPKGQLSMLLFAYGGSAYMA